MKAAFCIILPSNQICCVLKRRKNNQISSFMVVTAIFNRHCTELLQISFEKKQDSAGRTTSRSLWRMQDADTIVEFIKLWGLIYQVELTDHGDTNQEIDWHGQYMTKSTYTIVQQQGSSSNFDERVVLNVPTEGKHMPFTGLAIQNKVLTSRSAFKKSI